MTAVRRIVEQGQRLFLGIEKGSVGFRLGLTIAGKPRLIAAGIKFSDELASLFRPVLGFEPALLIVTSRTAEAKLSGARLLAVGPMA